MRIILMLSELIDLKSYFSEVLEVTIITRMIQYNDIFKAKQKYPITVSQPSQRGSSLEENWDRTTWYVDEFCNGYKAFVLLRVLLFQTEVCLTLSWDEQPCSITGTVATLVTLHPKFILNL